MKVPITDFCFHFSKTHFIYSSQEPSFLTRHLPLLSRCFFFCLFKINAHLKEEREKQLNVSNKCIQRTMEFGFFYYYGTLQTLCHWLTRQEDIIRGEMSSYSECLVVCNVGVSMGNGATTQELSCCVCEKGLGIRLFALPGCCPSSKDIPTVQEVGRRTVYHRRDGWGASCILDVPDDLISAMETYI